MRAVLVSEPGPPSNLTIGPVPTPDPGPDEVRVRVQATALNRADTFQRKGHYPPPEGASDILGLEMAGTVDATGPGVVDWSAGDRVCALLSGGGYAEYAVVHKDLLMALPPGLSMEEAAAIPEVFLTAFQALHWLGDLGTGDHVLIHAGASGVGTAAIQLTTAAEAHPYITASAPKHDLCRSLGAEATIDYTTEDFAAQVPRLTDGQGVNLILDFIGAPYVQGNIDSLAMDGRIIQLATLGGATVEQFSLRDLMAKRARLIATTLRSRSLAYKVKLTQDFASYAMPRFVDGTLQPVIDSVMDWTDVAAAHQRMENNENAGKIVLRVAP
ncbi:NAD(P)H-quinone oxidoreductase [Salisaeta longa]|uniref:NAD(P)H-quinone oxidoreductase n=1 Tax=Salisaeta longa TaxID=503170 RepID=UPI0003B4FD40|nr:NAD(P)H-quinone oxidoreductase [Salisaeta longa]